jgi:dolichol-phosphate mannosyltransferase
MTTKVSILLPTYCERGNILDLLTEIERAVDGQPWACDVMVIDDNSPDGTAEAARAFRPQGRLTSDVIVRAQERGLASAVLHGIRRATGDVVVVMDTDFNHDPGMIPQMVDFLRYYDIVIGSRFVMGGGMEDQRHYLYSRVYNLFLRVLLGIPVQDNLSGFFAVRRSHLLNFDLDRIFRGYGEYFMRLLFACHRSGYRMLEVPVFYNLRRHGHSKSQFVPMLLDYTRCAVSLWRSRDHWAKPSGG